MPQLVPFYFMNLLTYGFITIVIILLLASLILLPAIIKKYITRLFISSI